MSRIVCDFDCALSAPAAAADIKVISAGAVRGLIGGMIADYAQQTGHKFDFKVGTTGQLRAIIASGEPADLIIASGTLMGSSRAPARCARQPRRSRPRRHRRRRPRGRGRASDLSTPEAFKQALIGAFGRLLRSARGRNVGHLPDRRARAFRHRRRRHPQGGADQWRPRRGREGRAGRGRDRRHVDQRDRAGERRQAGRPGCRRRCSSTPSMRRRSRRAAPIRRPRRPSSPRSRTGAGGALAGGGLRRRNSASLRRSGRGALLFHPNSGWVYRVRHFEAAEVGLTEFPCKGG